MSLVDYLHDQRGQLDQLLDLLNRERELLGAGTIDGEALNAVAEGKQHVLTDLADGEHQRGVASGGLKESASLDEQEAREQGCLEAWREVRQRAREAASLNNFNGQLITMRMNSNRRLLNDLRALGGNEMYGPDGQTRGGAPRLASQA